MYIEELTTRPEGMAKVEVQRNFCYSCSGIIKKELENLNGIKNLRFYPSELLITFHFRKAEQLSDVLNKLLILGYPEKGENYELSSTNLNCCC